MAMLYAKQNPRRRTMSYMLSVATFLIVILVVPLLVAAIKEYPRYTRVLADVSPAPTALIFGAAVYPSGNPSPFLRDRLEGGIALYRAGTIQRLLMTGDHRESHYDEPGAMAAYVKAHGVPEEAIIMDGGGVDTDSSCKRAYTIYGVRQAVLVTQGYHQPRALALCRSEGINATGYSVTRWQMYAGTTAKYIMREVLSMFKADYNIVQATQK